MVTFVALTKNTVMSTFNSAVYLLAFLAFTCASQRTNAQVINAPKASLTLAFSQTSGTNGSAVAYNPDKNLYYALIAGNSVFPLEAFDANGNNVFTTECGSDMRGLWWNPKAKQLEGNGYGSAGIMALALDGSGYPSLGNSTIHDGSDHQPGSNSCGVFDGKKYIWYINGSYFVSYDRKKGTVAKSVEFSTPVSSESLNNTSVIYTGVKGMEFGVLDANNGKIYLIDGKSGNTTATIVLPADLPLSHSFRFAYANKHAFIYNTDTRSWTGLRIFI